MIKIQQEIDDKELAVFLLKIWVVSALILAILLFGCCEKTVVCHEDWETGLPQCEEVQ